MPSLHSAWNKLRWSIEKRGLAETLRVGVERLSAFGTRNDPPPVHPFDQRHGVDTGGFIGGGDLTAGHTHDRYITGYTGISPSRFQATMQRWSETPPAAQPADYTFVDLGSGKGRAVLLASQHPFREAVGVELNPQLAEVAQRNLAIWNEAGRALCPMRVVCGDATEVPLPPGPCLLYLANPFGAPVLRLLLETLEARAATDAATIDIVYQNPEQEAVFRDFPAFVRLWSEAIPFSAEDAAADLAYSDTDMCSMYRRAGSTSA